MSTTILLIRHGETAWNREKIFRGTCDVPLNENGRSQARQLAAALQARTIDAACTSPLQRAVETAEIVLEPHGISPVIDKRLIDFCYGEWGGMTEQEVAGRWPDEYEAWKRKPAAVRVPGGNTLREVFDVAFDAMNEIATRHDGQTVALFAHRVVNKLLVLGALGLPPERFPFIRQDNCCLNEFEKRPDGYVICTINDTSCLRGKVDLLAHDF